ncbi:UDP-glucose pyrophosphorylase (fragment) [Klebsiella variicola]
MLSAELTGTILGFNLAKDADELSVGKTLHDG